ncbi:hypothetical protein [Calothrix sp. 336/3]|uniref:hypothetical protein n=1 Tax=Calothrix sp. 336/3 TaxID=1337936 RepID=UPI0004E4700F|nr:hypothetical protein [Calothrix sp. 336/3]AKG20983.1 hypothetical protein IJ00_06430 [Calothrix sp. 336/3]
MFTIDLTVKNTAFPVSVQRKTVEDAEAVYQLILAAMRSGNPEIVELKCEGKTEKKVAVRASEISGVQVTQKEGTTIGGKQPGFFALAQE